MAVPQHVPGWVYAVQGPQDTKIGMTTELDVFSYMHKHYSRTYSSWRAQQLLWVDDCRHAEKSLLFLLREYRTSDKHEVVHCSEEVVIAAFRKVSLFFHDDPDKVGEDTQRAEELWQEQQRQKQEDKEDRRAVRNEKREEQRTQQGWHGAYVLHRRRHR